MQDLVVGRGACGTGRMLVSDCTVCPDLTRERYVHNVNSRTYVRMVARAASMSAVSSGSLSLLWMKATCQGEKSRENSENHCEQQTHYAARATILTYVLLLRCCVTSACQIWTHCDCTGLR